MNENRAIQKLLKEFVLVHKEIPELTFIGDSVLRTKTRTVSLKKGITIANRLKKTLKKYRKLTGAGRGLAAPQIGESVAVSVTYTDNKFQTFINPKIVKSSKKMNLYREQCMSIGILSADVKRPEQITLRWMDEKGGKHEEDFSGFMARLLQHEYDHLQGVVNIDIAIPSTIEFATKDPLKEKLRTNE